MQSISSITLPSGDNYKFKAACIPMGQLDSTSTSTAMTATVSGITELSDGVCLWLKNGVVTSASGVTLNINGLGAKPIYSSMAAETGVTTQFNANYTMLFVYDSTRVPGGCWDMVYGYHTNTTYSPAKLGQGYAQCSTAAATLAKEATISNYALTTGGIVSIRFTKAVPANATLNISDKGAKAIYYKNAAITDGVINAGDIATFIYSTYYRLISVDRAAPVISTSAPAMDGTAAAGSTGQVSDAGHVHPSDTSKVDTSALAYVETGTTASRKYSAGEYFYTGGTLYRAVQAIASGVSFNSGTGGNCEVVSGGGLNSVGQSEAIYSTATNVSTDTTVTTTRPVTAYNSLGILFNTSSSNPSNTRGFVNLPEFELQNSAYHPLCIDGTVGWVRLSRASGQESQVRVVSTSFSSLYLIAIIGIRR